MATGHNYGPHRPDDAPGMVEVYPPGKYADPMLAPIAHALTRQRVAINTVAHHGRLSRGLCRTCGRDEWDCLSVRPGPDAHEFEPSR